jgi:hypothetical protein
MFTQALSHTLYRLTSTTGEPHPVLDDLFESPDSAQEAALSWLLDQGLIDQASTPQEQRERLALHVGLERSTPSGDWRTLRYAGLTGAS